MIRAALHTLAELVALTLFLATIAVWSAIYLT